MSLADDLVTYLDANSTLTAGTNLFKHSLPETTSRCVAVIETPGMPAIEKFGVGLPAMTRPRAQIIARSTKAVGGAGIAGSTGARHLAKHCWETLTTVVNTTAVSPGILYQRIEPLQDPWLLHHDEAGRAVFVFNVQAMRTASTGPGDFDSGFSTSFD